MTALAPSYLWTSTGSATVTSPDTLGNLGFIAGDLLVIKQYGEGSGTTTPSPPTIAGSSTGFTDGPSGGGTDAWTHSGSGARRTQFWSKILVSGDLSQTVTVNKAGYTSTAHRFAIGRLSHADGFDSSRIFESILIAGSSLYGPRSITGASWASGTVSLQFSSSQSGNYAVGEIIQVEGMTNSAYDGWFVITAITTTSVSNDTLQYALASNPGGSSSGAQVTKVINFGNPTRPSCAFIGMSFNTSAVACTLNIDGALSGSNYHRTPYFNSGTGSSQTDAVHGHHYNTGTVVAQGDFQEYDTADTPQGVTINNNMGGTAQAIVIVVYQTAPLPADLSGKMSNVLNMKGDLQAGLTEIDGKMSNVLNMKGDLFTSSLLEGKLSNISDAGAPDSIGEVTGPGTQDIEGKLSNKLNAKADLLVISPNYLSGKLPNVLNAKGILDFGSVSPVVGSGYNLIWDKLGEREYQRGLDRGVLYLKDGTSVVWNGLTEVTEKAPKVLTPVYYDGMKIGQSIEVGAFEGTLKAITYPDEFALLEGFGAMRPGVLVDNQRPQTFDLSYRTLIGNSQNPDAGYKIHLIYNVTAIPSDKTHTTINDSLSIEEFQWDISAVPQEIPGFAPTAHLVFDSTETDPWLLENLESIFYGNGNIPPNLPNLEDLAHFISEWYRVEIVDNGDGTWTAIALRDGYIFFGPDGSFEIKNVNAVFLDASTYVISNT